MHQLPGYLKFVYVYLSFNVKRHVSETIAHLIWSTRFEMNLAWPKRKKAKGPYFKLINLTLFYVHQNLRQWDNKCKIGTHEGYFSVKNSARIEFFSQTKPIAHVSFRNATLNRFFCLDLTGSYTEIKYKEKKKKGSLWENSVLCKRSVLYSPF